MPTNFEEWTFWINLSAFIKLSNKKFKDYLKSEQFVFSVKKSVFKESFIFHI